MRCLSVVGCFLLLFVAAPCLAQSRGRPAPPPSRYAYTLEVDVKALPKGVTVREAKDEGPQRWFIANSSDTPLVIDERFQDKVLVTATKLMGGKVYHYFPNGVPMEGKMHLKGWQAPFGDIPETILRLPRDPEKIYAGRAAGLGKELPAPEAFSIPATFDGMSRPITGTIHYHLNEAYDEFYQR